MNYVTIMCLCINNDDFMHNKCYFLLNYRTHFYHCNYLRSLKSNKTAHKILIAAQKLKKLYKNLNSFVFERKFLMKTILTSFDFMQNFDFILTYKF